MLTLISSFTYKCTRRPILVKKCYQLQIVDVIKLSNFDTTVFDMFYYTSTDFHVERKTEKNALYKYSYNENIPYQF